MESELQLSGSLFCVCVNKDCKKIMNDDEIKSSMQGERSRSMQPAIKVCQPPQKRNGTTSRSEASVATMIAIFNRSILLLSCSLAWLASAAIAIYRPLSITKLRQGKRERESNDDFERSSLFSLFYIRRWMDGWIASLDKKVIKEIK